MSNNIPIYDDVLIKYLLQETTIEETQWVEQWLKESEENKIYFNQIKTIWDQSKLLQQDHPIDEEEAWLRLKSKLINPKSNSIPFHRYLFSSAALILILLGLFWLFYKPQTNIPLASTKPNQLPIQTSSLNAEQETRIDTLSDRSVVTLNKHASLAIPKVFESHERRVKLSGEAFFSISPDKRKPFVIETQNDVEITVLGTSFNVKAFPDYTEVIVETGLVRLKKFDKTIFLHADEMARIDNIDSTIHIKKNKDKLYKYFRSKEFECDNTPLWKVVEVLNEAYTDSVVIGNNDLKKLSLTTRFNNESLESILEVLSETFEFQVQKKGNIYILK